MTSNTVAPLDGKIIETVMTDPLTFPVLRELDWATVPYGTLLERIPGSGPAIGMLLDAGILYETDEGLRMTEAYQGFIFGYDGSTAPECFSLELRGWHRQLGLFVSEAVYLLTGALFDADLEKDMLTDAEDLLVRGGLMDPDGGLTGKGRDVAYNVFRSIAGIFDTVPVDPDELFGRWMP